MIKRRSKLVRVDADVWDDVRSTLPGITDRKRSAILYKTSAVRVERVLQDVDFKDSLGGFLYGKKNWKKQKR